LQVQVHIFEAVRGRLPTPSAPCADGSARTLCLRNPATDLSGTCGWFGPESVVALVMDSSQMHGPGSGSHTPGGTPQAGYGASASGTPAHGITSSVTVQQEPGRTNQAVCERYAPQQNQHAIQQQAGQDGAAAMASSGGFQLPMPSPPPPYVSLTGTPQQSCGAYIPFAPCGQSSTQAASQPSHDDVQLPGWQPLTPQSGGSFAGTSTPPQQQTAACAVGTGAQGDATAVCAPAASRPMQSGMQQAGQMMQNAFRAGMARLSGAGMQGYAQLPAKILQRGVNGESKLLAAPTAEMCASCPLTCPPPPRTHLAMCSHELPSEPPAWCPTA